MIVGASGDRSIWLPLRSAPAPGASVALGGAGKVSIALQPALAPAGQAPRLDSAAEAIAAAAVASALDLDFASIDPGARGAPSISTAAQMAAGSLGLLRGAAVETGAVIVGGLLPDGSVAGPVSPRLIERAAAAGFRRIGFPAGMRHIKDVDSGDSIDLVELAASRKVVAVEVADLAAAFRFATGNELPRGEPLDEDQMELDGDAQRQVTAIYQRWRMQIAPEWARVLERGEAGMSDALRRLKRRAERLIAEAEADLADGLAPSGLYRLVAAYGLTRHLARAAAPGPRPEPAVLESEADALIAEIAAASEAAMGEEPETLGRAVGHLARARLLASAAAMAAAARARASEPVRFFALEASARAALGFATDAATLEGSWGGSVRIAAGRAATLSEAHRAAAALLARELAEPGAAVLAATATRGAEARKRGSRGALLFALGATREGHQRLGWKLAQAKLLGVESHPVSGEPVAVAAPRALDRLLDLADRWARRRARAARIAAGAVPVSARLAYQSARRLRAGELPEQLEALELYWRAGAESELALTLARP